MNSFLEIVGKACEILLPIDNAVFLGNTRSEIVICTLSSITLAKQLSDQVLSKVNLVGRLLSENKGIDSILHYLYENKNIYVLLVCGKEVMGHKAGHSLIQLHKFGVNENNYIINSSSPFPKLNSSKALIDHFRQNVSVIDKIDEINPIRIQHIINSLKSSIR